VISIAEKPSPFSLNLRLKPDIARFHASLNASCRHRGARLRIGSKLGQHNTEIFGRTGLSEQDIETLQAQRVV